jgi:hypothetical protein
MACVTLDVLPKLWVFGKNGRFFAFRREDSKLEINRRLPGILAGTVIFSHVAHRDNAQENSSTNLIERSIREKLAEDVGGP